jgi:hypothetical protein
MPPWRRPPRHRRLRGQRGLPHLRPLLRRPTAAAPAALPQRPPPAPVPNKGDVSLDASRATLLVIMMSIPGLALFYGGLVRSKNMLSVLMQVFVTFSMIVVLWVPVRLQPGLHRGQRLHRWLRPPVHEGRV